MKLRIISGLLKGRYVSIPESGGDFRPTLERTRESVAEILKPYIENSIAADVCAGSGAFGFELISRGAARVDFIENDYRRSALIEKNAQCFNVADRCKVIRRDAGAFTRDSQENYDLIFFDPPYNNSSLHCLIGDILKLLSPDGILAYQRPRDFPKDVLEKRRLSAEAYDKRTFGETVVEFYNATSGERS
jgi:16S rRNA (guanine966-N2)-methyltransferase